jgi:hypothetical protein
MSARPLVKREFQEPAFAISRDASAPLAGPHGGPFSSAQHDSHKYHDSQTTM